MKYRVRADNYYICDIIMKVNSNHVISFSLTKVSANASNFSLTVARMIIYLLSSRQYILIIENV